MTVSKTKYTSTWSAFLNKNREDPYMVYKDKIAYQLEEIILQIENDLLNSKGGWNTSSARQMAICLAMEQVLNIQYEYAPKTLEAMTVALFTDLPGLKDFRMELLEKAQDSERKKWIKKIFFWKK